ncbi:MAG: hypothetical protein HFI34_09870 [Lachnospiraceae bacterium]|nr:hypothetical protein [Lachnospiraceae bacterium]
MTFKTEKRLLMVVSQVFASEINEVYVCRDIKFTGNLYYTVILIKQRQIGGQIIKAFETCETEESLCPEYFSAEDSLGLVLPYENERPLTEFYMGNLLSPEECEVICINLVIQCMVSKIPPQLLYLILTQKNIQIQRDNSISFSWFLDLGSYDDNRTGRDCARRCGEIIVSLLEPCRRKKGKSYDLIRKKTYKRGYTDFSELYRDIILTGESEKKPGLRTKWKHFLESKKDILFRLLLFACIILILLTLVILLSQILSGEVRLFRLFINPFKKIGTETLI